MQLQEKLKSLFLLFLFLLLPLLPFQLQETIHKHATRHQKDQISKKLESEYSNDQQSHKHWSHPCYHHKNIPQFRNPRSKYIRGLHNQFDIIHSAGAMVNRVGRGGKKKKDTCMEGKWAKKKKKCIKARVVGPYPQARLFTEAESLPEMKTDIGPSRWEKLLAGLFQTAGLA